MEDYKSRQLWFHHTENLKLRAKIKVEKGQKHQPTNKIKKKQLVESAIRACLCLQYLFFPQNGIPFFSFWPSQSKVLLFFPQQWNNNGRASHGIFPFLLCFHSKSLYSFQFKINLQKAQNIIPPQLKETPLDNSSLINIWNLFLQQETPKQNSPTFGTRTSHTLLKGLLILNSPNNPISPSHLPNYPAHVNNSLNSMSIASFCSKHWVALQRLESIYRTPSGFGTQILQLHAKRSSTRSTSCPRRLQASGGLAMQAYPGSPPIQHL